MRKIICFAIFIVVILLSGCSSDANMKDGFYTAEMSEYSYGWREYLCIMVKNDAIVYAEFNAKDPSGYIKAWDNLYMKRMLPADGTYPNEYTRNYTAQLIKMQNNDIDALTGATNSGENFKKLSLAVIEQAKKGDTNVIVVE